MANHLNWDLESIFAGGSGSAGLADFIEQLEAGLARAEGSPPPSELEPSTHPEWLETVRTLDDLGARLAQARSFVGCLEARDVGDERARVISADLMTLSARLDSLWTRLNALAADQPDPRWLELVATPDLVPSAFALTEGRTLARRKMPPEKETLVNDLAGDGYHAWGQLYNTAAGLRQVEVDMDGARARQSLGQLQNTFTGHPDRRVRRLAYEAYTTAWQDLAPIAAMALNHQAGFRLNLYRHRGWRSVLEEPLFNNRLQRATVDTMWRVTADRAPRLLPFFEAKARLMGIDRLAWYDVTAPVGGLAGTMGFAEAGDFVVDSIRPVNPDIADFCRMALEKRWVEAEDRPGKRAGAFCTSLPLLGESRVFMTFSGSFAGLTTLAHELGHGYHGWVLKDLPYGARHYTMGVAETASTLNERVVTDAGLRRAEDDRVRLSMLNQKVGDAVMFLMNIRARYDFERAFFRRRKKGNLNVEQLCGLMVEAQKKAFAGALDPDGHDPLFWASKLHFYITRAPFYNFPYTFGYLFSEAVYHRAKEEGLSFVDRYAALLRDTGSMTTEDLARKHLGVDLTGPAFWEETLDRVLRDVDDFVALADKSRQPGTAGS